MVHHDLFGTAIEENRRFVELIRSVDWSDTALGSICSWHVLLRNSLEIIFRSSQPMCLVWGPRKHFFYNFGAVQLILEGDLSEINLLSGQGLPLTADRSARLRKFRDYIESLFAVEREDLLLIHNQRFNAPSIWQWSILRDTDESPLGFFGNAENLRAVDLQRREEQLRLITNALPALIAYVDKNNVYRFNSKMYEVWFGRPAESFTGRHVREVLGDAAYQSVSSFMDEALAGRTVAYETQVPYKNGGTRYIRAQYVPHRDTNGEVEGYFSLVTDISEQQIAFAERARAIDALRESEKNFRAIFSLTSVGIAEADVESRRFLQVNSGFCVLTGFSEDELRGLTVEDLNHPDDRDRDRQSFLAMLTGNTPTYQSEKRYVCKDGSIRWVLATGNVIRDNSGKPLRTFAVIQDITARKRRELHDQFLKQLEIELAQQADPTLMKEWVIKRLAEYLEAQCGLLIHFDSEGQDSRIEVEWPAGGSSYFRDYLLERASERDIQSSLASGRPITIDCLEAREGTEARWSEVRSLALVGFSGHGRLAAILSIGSVVPREWRDDEVLLLQDISARVWPLIEQAHAARALRESEERFRISQDLSLDAFMILDAVRDSTGEVVDFLCKYGNPKAAELFEQPIEQLINKYLSLGPHRGWMTNRLLPLYREIIEIGMPHDLEVSLESKSGHRWFRSMAVKLGDGVAAFLSDITDRKDIEDELRTSEERLRFAVEGAALGTWEYDVVTGDIVWSERCKTMFGLDQDAQINYETFLNAIHPEDRDRVHQAVEDSLRDRGRYDIELRSSWPDGSIHWIRSIGRARYDCSGRPTDMIGVALDITAHKEAEEAARTSADRLGVALAASNLGDWSWDARTDVVTFSSRAAEIFALPPGPYMTWTEMLEILHPEDREHAQSQVQMAIKEKVAYDIEYRIVHPDGTQRWVAAKGRAQFDYQDQLIGMLGVVQDITSRREAELERELLLHRERRYADQLSGLTKAAVEINSALSVEQVLKVITIQAARIIGAHQASTIRTLNQDRSQAFTARYLSDRYSQEAVTNKRPDISTLHLQVCNTNQVVRLSERELDSHPDWQTHILTSSLPPRRGWLAAPLVRRDGSNMGLVELSDKDEGDFTLADEGILIQLTQMASIAMENAELYEAEQRARSVAEAAREEAQSANHLKDEFLAVLSHELRSPLSSILGWSRLLRSGKLDPSRQAEALATIERNAKVQTQLIEDLLDISRIMQGKLSLAAEAVSLNLVVSAAVETIRLAAEAKQIEIITELSPVVTPVLGDAARLQQVVWNLLTNAIKFTLPGGQITVELRQMENLAQVRVVDTGKGISLDFLPHVFEYFRQADSTTTRKFGGLGLGLAIVRQIVEMHGGTVRAESGGENLGATFTVQLPLMQQSSISEVDSLLEETPEVSFPNDTLKGLQILVVDDDHDTRRFQAFLLEQYGARVIPVTSGKDALITLDQIIPDLIVSDIGMADMDGYMLIRQIRSRSDHQGGSIPALALTAYARDLDHEKALRAGFQAHITKPVDAAKLIGAIKRILFQSRSSIVSRYIANR